MKQQINEIKRMQQLAGIIAENQTNENIHNTIQMGGMFGGRNFSAEAEEDKKAVEDIKAAIANGASEKDAIEQVSKKYKLYSDYLKRRYDQSNKVKEEALKEGRLSPEAYERMDSLVNEKDMDMLYDGGRNIVADLTNEGFEDADIIEFICQSLKNFL